MEALRRRLLRVRQVETLLLALIPVSAFGGFLFLRQRTILTVLRWTFLASVVLYLVYGGIIKRRLRLTAAGIAVILVSEVVDAVTHNPLWGLLVWWGGVGPAAYLLWRRPVVDDQPAGSN